MYGNNDYRDYLMHWGKGESAPNHKYSAKEWINGAWRYFYGNASKAATGIGIRAKNDVAALRNKASRALSTRSTKSMTSKGYGRKAFVNAVKGRGRHALATGYFNLAAAGESARDAASSARNRASKAATGLGIRAKNDVAAVKKKAGRVWNSEPVRRTRNAVRAKSALAINRAKTGARNARNTISSALNEVRRSAQLAATKRRRNKAAEEIRNKSRSRTTLDGLIRYSGRPYENSRSGSYTVQGYRPAGWSTKRKPR